MPSNHHRSSSSKRHALILLPLFFAACSSSPNATAPLAQSGRVTDLIEQGGYQPVSHYQIVNHEEHWTHDGVTLDITMTVPADNGKYPLIMYLPGIGEDSHAGQVWRETWAKAGYAVLCMQSLPLSKALQELRGNLTDPSEWDKDERESSPLDFGLAHSDVEQRRKLDQKTSRNSELRYIGHEYFAVNQLRIRLQELSWTYQQLKARSDSGQAIFRAADTSQVIIAGYELGAQTASAAAGENFDVPLPLDAALKPKAIILLSPSVDLATGNVRNRYNKLLQPLLVISGSRDSDPYAITTATARRAIWDYAPADNNKYLLWLQGASHRLMAGNDMGEHFNPHQTGWFGDTYNSLDNDTHGSGSSARSAQNKNTSGRPGRLLDEELNSSRQPRDLGYRHVAAIASVSTAFLDSLVKKDQLAGSWLSQKAGSWLSQSASLLHK